MKLKYHTGIYGVTQAGKTFKALQLLHAQKDSILIHINTKGEKKYTHNNKKNKWQNIFDYQAETFRGIDDVLDNPKRFAGQMCCLTPDMDEDLTEGLTYVCDEILRYLRNDGFYKVVLLIDELQEYLSGRQSKQTKIIRRAFISGLGQGLRIIFTTQGWSMINKNIRNNCEITIILKQREKDIIDMMDLGLIPYKKDKNGHKICELRFNRKYAAYMEYGIGGTFGKLDR